MPRLTFHLIPNAHLDPVWLWDWREGLTEGIITCRTILDLMDEDPELTFIRGEAAIYHHIEKHDPKTFKRIARYVDKGRWDVVGGTWIQPDTNLPATETFDRHFTRAQNYFDSRFGKCARVAWTADSFGHSAGLPEIYARAGIEAVAFTRPSAEVVPIDKPAFWWQAPSGARILAYRPLIGWYGMERDEILRRLDQTLEAASKQDLQNVGVFIGLGNHGGGPSRRHIAEARQWAEAHRGEVNVIFSGLHRLFDALRAEGKRKGEAVFPTHRGELNFVLRGCYSSVAKFKFPYRKTEALLAKAERTDAIISAAVDRKPADLTRAWDAILFNSFHDILPGSSIERAYDDQIAWLGEAFHQAQRIELSALDALAAQVDTRVRPPATEDHPSAVAALVWNPHPWPLETHVEVEASLDYRPIWAYRGKENDLPLSVLNAAGKPLPFQSVATEHSCSFGATEGLPWRKRVVTPVKVPAMGWTVLEMGWVEGATPPPAPTPSATSPRDGVIDNGHFRIEAEIGAAGVKVFRDGQPIFAGDGLSAAVFDDRWGSWGGMAEQPDSTHLNSVRERWQIADARIVESGPERAALWVRLSGRRSRIDLTFALYRDRRAVDVSARVLWDERSARLKLVMPGAEYAEYDVPGAQVNREQANLGEVPGGRWVRVAGSPAGAFGFASDALYNFDVSDGQFRATVVRATRYADDNEAPPDDAKPWQPAVDCGELKFQFLLTAGDDGVEQLAQLAAQLEQPPTVLLVPPKKGKLARSGSLASIEPSSLKLLALKPAEDRKGFVLRVQETTGRAVRPRLTWLGKTIKLDKLGAHQIASWRLIPKRAGLKIKQTDTTETS